MAYAILGATGNCGTALIQHLQQSSATIHAYCRNKAKLLTMLPGLAESTQSRIFEGSIHDVRLLTACLRGTRTVFLVVSTNDNIPIPIAGEEFLRDSTVNPDLLSSCTCEPDALGQESDKGVPWFTV